MKKQEEYVKYHILIRKLSMKLCHLLFLVCIFSFHSFSQNQPQIESELVLLDIKTGKEKIILHEKEHFEAPNWSRDGSYLIYNCNGKIEKISVDGKKLGTIDTGFADRCNNDHGFTFDGKNIIISHNDNRIESNNGNSRIFILPANGGEPQLLTSKAPSYWHGVSPDNLWIVYCALRNGEWDIYKNHIFEDNEIRLTTAPGLDDGPEFSYDGKWIYFNSHRTGRMHIYRMRPDGSEQTQLTFDEFDNWFPHPGPDNISVVYISYLEDQKGGHPFGKDVKLRLLNVESGEIKDLTQTFYGGQGSLNVHSWSPDGEQIAFVRYINLN